MMGYSYRIRHALYNQKLCNCEKHAMKKSDEI